MAQNVQNTTTKSAGTGQFGTVFASILVPVAIALGIILYKYVMAIPLTLKVAIRQVTLFQEISRV